MVALLVFYVAMALTASWQKGLSYDEGLQIAAGYNIWLRDDLRIEVWITKVGRTSISLRYDFVRASDATVLARARERRVHVLRDGAGKMSSSELSDAMRVALAPHLDTTE